MRMLTDAYIRNLKRPTQGQLEVIDEHTRGLRLIVTAKRRTWYMRYQVGNRQFRVKLGEYGEEPLMTLKKARDAAAEVTAKVGKGENPAAERDKRRALPTFETWTKEYLAAVGPSRKSTRQQGVLLERATKRFGRKRLDEIAVSDIDAFVRSQIDRAIKEHGRRAERARKAGRTPKPLPELPGHTSGRLALAAVRSCLSHAVRAGLIDANPAAKVKQPRTAPPRQRVLTAGELERAVKAIQAEKDERVRAVFMLLVLTGCRVSEARTAKLEDFDLNGATWTIPSPKAGRLQVVPLPASVVEMLRGLSDTDNPFLLPGRYSYQPRADLKKPWDRIKAAIGADDVHIHDLRRSFGLRVAKESGLHVASKLLRHSDVRITEQVYAPLGLDDLRTASEKAANVVKFRGREEEGEEKHRQQD